MPHRIPSLDGLRALAISLVLVGHCSKTVPPNPIPGPLWEIFGNGHLGVLVFFCISGFLITRLLLGEEDKHGAISLRKFYLRRAFRILPAFLFFLLFVTTLKLSGIIQVTTANILSALFFVTNYSPANLSWILGHTWSLSVEEQFYLFWPALLVFCGRRRVLWIGIALIFLSPPWRVAQYFLLPESRGQIGIMTHTQIDALMYGCVAAIAWGEPWFERLYAWFCRLQLHWILPLFALVASPLIPGRGMYMLPVGYGLNALAATLLMVWLIRNPLSRMGRVMNLPFVAWIGVLSYSLYLWQQAFFSDVTSGWWTHFGVNIACVFGCALVSYYAIERPFLRLRAKWIR